MAAKLAEILDEKGREVFQVEAVASVREAVQLMVEKNVGSLLVTDGGEIAGIFTERDFLRLVALDAGADQDRPVGDLVSRALVVATPETTVEECMALMTDRRIRHVPVVEDGAVAGMVSIGDVVEFRSRRQAFEIQYLTDYITSG